MKDNRYVSFAHVESSGKGTPLGYMEVATTKFTKSKNEKLRRYRTHIRTQFGWLAIPRRRERILLFMSIWLRQLSDRSERK